MTSVFRPSARALITGGASGIGYAVAELCLKHSMKVTIADFNQETLDLAKKKLKGDVSCVKADVGERTEWKKLKQEVGDVDFLMLNAGKWYMYEVHACESGSKGLLYTFKPSCD